MSPVDLVTARRVRLPRFDLLVTLIFDVCSSNINVVLALLELWPMPATLNSTYMHVWHGTCEEFHNYERDISYRSLPVVYQSTAFNLLSPLPIPIGINSPLPISSCSSCAMVFPRIISEANTRYPTLPPMYLAPQGLGI